MTKAREPGHTVAFIDDYCSHYRPVFPHVRQFEQFTRLELGLVARSPRPSANPCHDAPRRPRRTRRLSTTS